MGTYASVRPATSKLLDMMDEGAIDARTVANMALSWLSEHDVADMMDEGAIDARTVADMALSWLSENDVADMMRAYKWIDEEDEDFRNK